MQDLLAKLNSHKAGLIGLLVFVTGLAADPNFLALIHLLPDATATAAQRYVAEAAQIAGLILAYLGKPKTV